MDVRGRETGRCPICKSGPFNENQGPLAVYEHVLENHLSTVSNVWRDTFRAHTAVFPDQAPNVPNVLKSYGSTAESTLRSAYKDRSYVACWCGMKFRMYRTPAFHGDGAIHSSTVVDFSNHIIDNGGILQHATVESLKGMKP